SRSSSTTSMWSGSTMAGAFCGLLGSNGQSPERPTPSGGHSPRRIRTGFAHLLKPDVTARADAVEVVAMAERALAVKVDADREAAPAGGADGAVVREGRELRRIHRRRHAPGRYSGGALHHRHLTCRSAASGEVTSPGRTRIEGRRECSASPR